MNKTRIKICGLTRAEDVDAALDAGADALGFVFYEHSKRAVSIEQVAVMLRRLPPFVCSVGLFVDAEPEYVKRVTEALPLSLLQFHGEESAEYCSAFATPYIKAVRMAMPGGDALARESSRQLLQDAVREHTRAAGILLDAYDPNVMGGTGQAFDWSLVPESIDKPVILAGGLNAGNVQNAISIVKPYAVDVSSGVELLPGIKDPKKMADFARRVSCKD